MISLNSSDRTVTRSLTGRYLASLAAVALVAIVGQALIQKQLTRHERDLKIMVLLELPWSASRYSVHRLAVKSRC